MPTYEYVCTSCTHEWELEQSIREEPAKECPSCHASTARRQISRGTGFILKGGGWYSDLYASSSNKKTDSTKSDSTKSESSSSETKSDSKPESKSDTAKSSVAAA